MAVKQLHLFCFKAGLDSANYVNESEAAQSQSILLFITITTEQLSAMMFVT